MMRVLRAIGVAFSLAVVGCSSARGAVVTFEGTSVDVETIDKDAWALLPPGMVGVMAFSAHDVLATPLGARVDAMVAKAVPAAYEAGLIPTQVVTRVTGASYASQGADGVGVLTTSLGPEFEQKLGASAMQRTTYVGRPVYVQGKVALTVLTQKTMLMGTETSVRRALEKLARGDLTRAMPAWMTEIQGGDDAHLALASDFEHHAVAGSLVHQLPFLKGIRTATVLSKYAPPNVHLVGTLNYESEGDRQSGAEFLRSVDKRGLLETLVLAAAGLSIPSVTVEEQGTAVKFSTSASEKWLSYGMTAAEAALPQWLSQ